MLDPSIFRAYDIRGIVTENLSAENVREIGRAIASQALDKGQSQLIVARDGRLSGPALKQAITAGIKATGCDVIDIGAVPSPVLYYATKVLGCSNGVMITGSHNPPEYNGIKMVIADHTLAGEEIQRLYQRIQAGNFHQGQGGYQERDIQQAYIDELTANIKLARPLTVVVDAGNGIVGSIAPACLRALGCQVIELYCEVDGTFPNHHPDPSEEKNLKDLKAAVAKHQADLGLAFDGDGDRLGVVTHQGEAIMPDRQMIVFARDVLKDQPNGKIIYDVKCSLNLAKEIHKAGGQAIMTKTGHSFVKQELKDQQAVLAGEMSGHIFFADRWFGFDDGIYAGARLLEIISRQHDLQAFWQQVPGSINTPEIKLPVKEQDKFALIEQFIANSQFPGAEKITIDGLRVEYPHSWGLLRASNTTPCLVMRFEADDERILADIQEKFKKELQPIIPGVTW